MKKPKTTTILLATFTALTVIAFLTVYAVHQTPTEETVTQILCTYTSTATYDYTAILQTPNIIYNNKTTLKPEDQTPIYTRLTRQINLTLTYNFEASLPAETQITYTITQTLKTTAWTHQIYMEPTTTTNQTQIQITLPPIIKVELDQIKNKIDSETGTTTTTYTLEITPTFTVKANTSAGQIYQTFTPTLTVTFQRTEKGEITSLEPLQQTKTGRITQNQTITHPEAINQRYMAYGLTAITLSGLAFSIYFHNKTKPKTPKKPIEKLMAPHKNLIAETTQKPPTTPTTIEVKTLEDLAKIAEILAKPILHTTEADQHTFYIIDNNTKYQYKT
ncbi:MAG: DUF5305 family protein [Candidatus Bathyarchaeia archaeon]